jgi:hypothetical protein
MADQAELPPAMAALHNFIMKHDPKDINNYLDNSENDLDPDPGATCDDNDFGALSEGAVTQAEKTHATETREGIANAMWDHYQEILGRRQEEQ